MSELFDSAFEVAQKRYRYPINHYEEYEDYFVFDYDDGTDEIHVGGDMMPIVIRKSDLAALSYAPIFFNLEEGEEVGPLLKEGKI